MKKLLTTMLMVTAISNTLLPEARRGDLTRAHDPIPQYMVANFFNILIKGAQAITAETSEDQIKATADVLNSIANLAQLAMHSEKSRMSDTESNQIHKLAGKLYRALVNNEEFMRAIRENRKEVCVELTQLCAIQGEINEA